MEADRERFLFLSSVKKYARTENRAKVRRSSNMRPTLLYNRYIISHEKHPFHLVDPSPWPFLTAIAALKVTWGLQLCCIGCKHGPDSLLIAFLVLAFFLYRWFRDIITEANSQGHHTRKVVQSLKYGMMLFIVSEVMFFFSFFFAYFYYCLNPSIWVGAVWPPKGVVPLNPWILATVNTGLLLSSSITLTWAHHAAFIGDKVQFLKGLAVTILLAFFFLGFQYLEYKYATFHINDSVYGSIFFMITGFHGFHVFLGTVFLLSCFWRVLLQNTPSFNQQHHFGFVAAVWYWHFVDVIWLFVFMIIYVWGGWQRWVTCSAIFSHIWANLWS